MALGRPSKQQNRARSLLRVVTANLVHVRKARRAALAAGGTGPSTALPACPGAKRRSLRGLAKHAIDRATCARVNRPAHLHVRQGEETLLGDQGHLHPAELEPSSGGAGCRPRAAEHVEPCTTPSSNLIRAERGAGQEQHKPCTTPSPNLVRVEPGAGPAQRSRERWTYITPSSNLGRTELGAGQLAG